MTDTSEPTERTMDTIPIERNWDMDSTTVSLGVWGGQPPFSEFAAKGRCKRCWGSLRGRTDPAGAVTGIRCIVCGELLEGTAAAAEAKRTSEESFINALNMMLGHQPKYGDGPFAQKVFPKIDWLSEQELSDRVALSKSHDGKNPRGRLTRHEFPGGAPGWFFLQARALLDGVSGGTDYEGDSIADFSDYQVNPDGSVTVRIDAHALSQNPRHQEQELLTRAGLLLPNEMIAAFACEFALKAISMTCTDEARKIHDLLELFDNLRENSRDRLEADFSTMQDVLTEHRGTFGTWRFSRPTQGPMLSRESRAPNPHSCWQRQPV
ncbi:MAG: hypothetical protein J4G11_10770 [Acidimicrobiia bacterium]|nr:hypothetical protein [Acidimicrobiia bacterium]